MGRQRRNSAGKPLVQTSVDSSVDGFWLYLHAKRTMIIKTFNTISAECRHFLHKQL